MFALQSAKKKKISLVFIGNLHSASDLSSFEDGNSLQGQNSHVEAVTTITECKDFKVKLNEQQMFYYKPLTI